MTKDIRLNFFMPIATNSIFNAQQRTQNKKVSLYHKPLCDLFTNYLKSTTLHKEAHKQNSFTIKDTTPHNKRHTLHNKGHKTTQQRTQNNTTSPYLATFQNPKVLIYILNLKKEKINKKKKSNNVYYINSMKRRIA